MLSSSSCPRRHGERLAVFGDAADDARDPAHCRDDGEPRRYFGGVVGFMGRAHAIAAAHRRRSASRTGSTPWRRRCAEPTRASVRSRASMKGSKPSCPRARRDLGSTFSPRCCGEVTDRCREETREDRSRSAHSEVCPTGRANLRVPSARACRDEGAPPRIAARTTSPEKPRRGRPTSSLARSSTPPPCPASDPASGSVRSRQVGRPFALTSEARTIPLMSSSGSPASSLARIHAEPRRPGHDRPPTWDG